MSKEKKFVCFCSLGIRPDGRPERFIEFQEAENETQARARLFNRIGEVPYLKIIPESKFNLDMSRDFFSQGIGKINKSL